MHWIYTEMLVRCEFIVKRGRCRCECESLTALMHSRAHDAAQRFIHAEVLCTHSLSCNSVLCLYLALWLMCCYSSRLCTCISVVRLTTLLGAGVIYPNSVFKVLARLNIYECLFKEIALGVPASSVRFGLMKKRLYWYNAYGLNNRTKPALAFCLSPPEAEPVSSQLWRISEIGKDHKLIPALMELWFVWVYLNPELTRTRR